MLFRKDIEPCCAYCKRGTPVSETEVMCLKKGVVSSEGSCRAFRYDPLKRVPPRPAALETEGLKEADFLL